MTGFSVDKNGKQTGGLEQWATSLGKMVGSVKGLWQQLETGKKKFDAMNAAAGKSKSSFSDYIKYVSESEDATEAFGLATLYTRARVLLLNMALSTGLALAASLIVKKIAEASQSIGAGFSAKNPLDLLTSSHPSPTTTLDNPFFSLDRFTFCPFCKLIDIIMPPFPGF